MQARPHLVNPSLEELAAMDNAVFKQWFRGSPLERTGRKRLQRNVAIAMGNSRDPQHRLRLQAWAAGEDAVLAEAAAWALTKLHTGNSQGTESAAASGGGSASIVPIGPSPAG